MIVLVGDVHGCLEELDLLLERTGFTPGVDSLYHLGDLVDRGPDPVGTVMRMRELGARGVLGNHDEKHLRSWHAHRQGLPNPTNIRAHQLLWDVMPQEGWDYLEALPIVLQPVPGVTLVHAGVAPTAEAYARQTEEERRQDHLRIRYVSDEGVRLKSSKDETGTYTWPAGSVHWSEVYDGHMGFVFYGHFVWRDRPHLRNGTLGLDTGCCFGMSLTAGILDDDWDLERLVQVPSSQRYSWLTDDKVRETT
jgi:hypothetical protein